jgi:hypothetical protein
MGFGLGEHGCCDEKHPHGSVSSLNLVQILHDNDYAGTGGFCGHGQSGGSAAMAYSLAWYGLEAQFDKVVVSAGPVFGDIEQGCKVPNPGPVTVCPSGQFGCGNQTPYSASPTYNHGSGPATWTGDPTCAGTTTTSAQSNANWKVMSIVDTGADYSYPQTALSAWVCSGTSTNETGPQGQYYYSQFTAANGLPAYSVNLVSACPGAEGIPNGQFNGQSGLAAVTADMTSSVVGCIKRH